MRLLTAAALLSALFSTASAADEKPLPATVLAPPDAGTLRNLFDGDVESRVDADFNGDGLVDTAAVMRDAGHEMRSLQVVIGYADEVGNGHDPIDGVALDPYPLGDATLTFRKGVLVVEDLTGGTTAIASTYRYRYDPEEHRMRLIGDDVSHYSRTNVHDALEISTNRLTGVRLRKVLVLADDGYDPQPEVRETVPKTPIYMAEAPSPEETLGLDGQ